MMHVNHLLQKVCAKLLPVEGIGGVCLGGSRARGTDTPDSDVDVGIYYDGDHLDIAELNRAASALDDGHRPDLIAPPGAWGSWVNGGGWLVVDSLPVDLILRDIRRVEKAVEDCCAGRINAHYQPGHPHAYINTMYMGELAICRLLSDPSGRLSQLKAETVPYPKKMKEAVLDTFLFEAEFSCMLARKTAGKEDIYYISAHIVRSVSALNQVLFAINGEYCINEKKAVGMIEQFPQKPDKYRRRVEEIFSSLIREAEVCWKLEELITEVKEITANQ